MNITEVKTKVLAAMQDARANFSGSDEKFANRLGINPAQYNRIKNGDTEKVLADAKWITIARLMDVDLRSDANWNAAETATFVKIKAQLKHCQNKSVSAMLCDAADIGKTFTGRYYARNNKNAVYVDCSQVKAKQKLVRQIAKEFGVAHSGRYYDVYEDLVLYLSTLSNPLIILDEAGDLDYSAFLELKALWNRTEHSCGWYMMGADGLKEKIRRAIDNKKVGYTEIFSRYGKKYGRVTPDGREDLEKFIKTQAALIIAANAPKGTDTQKVLAKTNGSLRRIFTELSKAA